MYDNCYDGDDEEDCIIHVFILFLNIRISLGGSICMTIV